MAKVSICVIAWHRRLKLKLTILDTLLTRATEMHAAYKAPICSEVGLVVPSASRPDVPSAFSPSYTFCLSWLLTSHYVFFFV